MCLWTKKTKILQGCNCRRPRLQNAFSSSEVLLSEVLWSSGSQHFTHALLTNRCNFWTIFFWKFDEFWGVDSFKLSELTIFFFILNRILIMTVSYLTKTSWNLFSNSHSQLLHMNFSNHVFTFLQFQWVFRGLIDCIRCRVVASMSRGELLSVFNNF